MESKYVAKCSKKSLDAVKKALSECKARISSTGKIYAMEEDFKKAKDAIRKIPGVVSEAKNPNDYEVTVEFTLEQAAEAMSKKGDMTKALESAMDSHMDNYQDYKRGTLHIPKEFGEADKYFHTAVVRAANDTDAAAYDSAYEKAVIACIVERFEKIEPMSHEYMGPDGNFVTADAGVVDASYKNGIVTVTFKNPQHLINSILNGVGFFAPDIEPEEKMDAKEIIERSHNLIDYYDVWGERLPEPNERYADYASADDDYYKEMLNDQIGMTDKAEMIDTLESIHDEGEEINIDEIMAIKGNPFSKAELEKMVNQIERIAGKKGEIKGIKGEAQIQERGDQGLIENHPEWAAIVKEQVERAHDIITDNFETYSKDGVHEIEHKSRDGFISSNDGGYQSNSFTSNGALISSGAIGNLPDKAEKAIQASYDQDCEYALEDFKKEFATEIAGIPEDKLNYHDLTEMGKSNLAEKLSELQMSHSEDENASVMFQVRGMFSAPDSMTVQIAINWEAPYHRPKGQFEDYKEVDFEFTDTKDLKVKMKKAMDECLKAMKLI